MGSQRFDSLAKSLVTGATRRRAMKAALVGAAGGALALLGLQQPKLVASTGQCCLSWCRYNRNIRQSFGACISDCNRAPWGYYNLELVQYCG